MPLFVFAAVTLILCLYAAIVGKSVPDVFPEYFPWSAYAGIFIGALLTSGVYLAADWLRREPMGRGLLTVEGLHTEEVPNFVETYVSLKNRSTYSVGLRFEKAEVKWNGAPYIPGDKYSIPDIFSGDTTKLHLVDIPLEKIKTGENVFEANMSVKYGPAGSGFERRLIYEAKCFILFPFQPKRICNIMNWSDQPIR